MQSLTEVWCLCNRRGQNKRQVAAAKTPTNLVTVVNVRPRGPTITAVSLPWCYQIRWNWPLSPDVYKEATCQMPWQLWVLDRDRS